MASSQLRPGDSWGLLRDAGLRAAVCRPSSRGQGLYLQISSLALLPFCFYQNLFLMGKKKNSRTSLVMPGYQVFQFKPTESTDRLARQKIQLILYFQGPTWIN